MNNQELLDFEAWWKTRNSICKEIAQSGWMAHADKEPRALTDEQRDQAAARWATANTPIREAIAFIDGFDAARAILAANKELK